MEQHPRPKDHEWLERLRRRFVDVAARRVGSSDVEDVVHDALRVVAEKNVNPQSGLIDELPPLAWCFQVLRNSIGNHYQREATRQRRLRAEASEPLTGSGTAPTIAEELDSHETLSLVESALGEMRQTDPNCGRYLARLVDDARPQDIAAEEDLEPAVFYRRLYRCRQKLRVLLTARGVDV